jgi:TatD DNase family protein
MADYDRLKWSPRETQLKHLPRLLTLAKQFRLPMFLHSRTPESHADLTAAMKEAGWVNPSDASDGQRQWVGGVVHSFTGTRAEVKELVSACDDDADDRWTWVCILA